MTINELFRAFYVYISLCFFKRSPASLPYSNAILCLLILIVLVIRSMPISDKIVISLEHRILLAAASLVIMMIFLIAIVQFKKMAARWHKFAQAILGTQIVLFLILSPLLTIARSAELPIDIGGIVFLWALCIAANIFKKALDIDFLSAIFLVFAMEILSYLPFGMVIFEQVSQK